MAAVGDHDRAARLSAEALLLSAQFSHSAHRPGIEQIRRAQAVDAACGGDHDRAKMLIGQIWWFWQDDALVQLSEAVATLGDHDGAEALARQVTDPNQRSRALARLSVMIAGTRREASPAAKQERSNSQLLVQARQLIAEALVTGSWTGVVAGLARIDPFAVTALADEVEARRVLDFQFDSSKGQSH